MHVLESAVCYALSCGVALWCVSCALFYACGRLCVSLVRRYVRRSPYLREVTHTLPQEWSVAPEVVALFA